MNKEMQAINHDMGRLAEDARVLIAATVDMAGEEIGEARKRLGEALELGKGNFGRVRDKAMQGAKAADEAMHEYPYHLLGIGVGFGALIGYLITFRWVHQRG
jgi:ElaB/YqjD/DUF883 family membrane-anchored ribosome-binding protein